MTKYDPAFKPPLSYRFKTAIMTDSMFIREMTRLAEKSELEMMQWLADNRGSLGARNIFFEDVVLNGPPEALRSILTIGWMLPWMSHYIGGGGVTSLEMIDTAFSFMSDNDKRSTVDYLACTLCSPSPKAQQRLSIMRHVVSMLKQEVKDECLANAMSPGGKEGHLIAAKMLIEHGASLEKAQELLVEKFEQAEWRALREQDVVRRARAHIAQFKT